MQPGDETRDDDDERHHHEQEYGDQDVHDLDANHDASSTIDVESDMARILERLTERKRSLGRGKTSSPAEIAAWKKAREAIQEYLDMDPSQPAPNARLRRQHP